MNPDIFKAADADDPTVRAYIESEERAVERLVEVAEALKRAAPARAMQLKVEAMRRAREVLELRDLLDL